MKVKYTIVPQPYGKDVKFKEKIRQYKLADAFANYGHNEGHKHAKALAKELHSKGYKTKIVPKVGATGVYYRK